MNFGKNVAHALIDAGMNKKKLAKACEVSTSTITRICNSERNPSFDLALRIADALGTTVDALITGNMEGIKNAKRKRRVP